MDAPADHQQNILSWLQRRAIPLTSVVAGHGFADLQPLKPVIGGARIVAMGEATHGTREFFQLKHRLLELLVTEMGFTTFAMEANWPESLAVNDYVLHGHGDPAKLLAGLHFWTWNTEEVLDLIRWMRQFNSGSPDRKVTFAGFDAQYTALAAATITEYLTRVDPAFAAEIAPRMAHFDQEHRDYASLSETDVAALRSVLQDLIARLIAEEQPYVARSTTQEWRLACQHARILRQVDEQRRAGSDARGRYVVRDRAMADNIAWILEHQGPEGKIAVWAHNAHVTRDARGIFDGTAASMGMHLARMFGDDLVVVGFAFGEGEFRAVVKEKDDSRPIRAVSIGPPPDGSLDAMLARTGIPEFLLDLRPADGDVAAWFQQPRVARETGAFFESSEEMCETIVPRARYDLLAFIARTTSARPNPRLAPKR